MSNAIKYWREKKKPKVTQQQLADLIKIDRPTLSKMENPNIPIDPDEDLAIKISRILKCYATDILRNPPKKEDLENIRK